MDSKLLSIFICASLAGSAVYGMEATAEVADFVRARQADGINIQNAAVGIRSAFVNHNHVAGEHRYYLHNGQEFNQQEPLVRQLLYALLSGIKQSCFDTGNTGGKFVDYATRIGASVAVGLGVDALKNLWSRIFDKQALAEQNYQKKLAALATQEALIQSIAAQLKTLPRVTEEDKASYSTLHAQYVTMLKQFTAAVKNFISENQTRTQAQAA